MTNTTKKRLEPVVKLWYKSPGYLEILVGLSRKKMKKLGICSSIGSEQWWTPVEFGSNVNPSQAICVFAKCEGARIDPVDAFEGFDEAYRAINNKNPYSENSADNSETETDDEDEEISSNWSVGKHSMKFDRQRRAYAKSILAHEYFSTKRITVGENFNSLIKQHKTKLANLFTLEETRTLCTVEDSRIVRQYFKKISENKSANQVLLKYPNDGTDYQTLKEFQLCTPLNIDIKSIKLLNNMFLLMYLEGNWTGCLVYETCKNSLWVLIWGVNVSCKIDKIEQSMKDEEIKIIDHY